MFKEIPLSETKGKIVAGAAFSCTINQFVLTFTDGTFTTLGISRAYELGDEDIIQDDLVLFDFGDDKLIDLNIIDSEELKEKRKERDATYQRNQEIAERNRYEELKKKYGGQK